MSSFYGLLNNAALMLVLCVIYDTFNLHSIHRKIFRESLTGILVGVIAIAVMMTPWSLTPGVFFDTRWVLLSLCGLFFGVVPTLIAVVLAGAFRLYQGGAGGVVGTLVIITTAATGLGWRWWVRKYNRPLTVKMLYLFGLVVQGVMLSCMVLMPAQMRLPIIRAIAPPILIIYPPLTMLLGLILQRQEERRAKDKALVKEIRQRQEAEAEARKSETQLRTLIETMPDLIWLKNPEGAYLGCNKQFEALYNISQAELVGKTDEDLTDALHAEAIRKDDARVISGGRPRRSEHTLTYACDGHTEIVETIKAPMYDAFGQVIGVMGVGRDITARKEGEKALRKSKEEWERTFNAISDIISIQDPHLRILKINRAGCQALDMEIGDILGQFCYQLYQGRETPCPDCPLAAATRTLSPHSGEMVYARLNKTFLVSASPVLDDDGKLAYITHAARDITEKKKLEEKLFQAQKMESIGTLAGGIAHDFNNILYAIMGYAELAKEKMANGEPADKDLDQIVTSGRRAAELIRHILTFSRKSDHHLTLVSPAKVTGEVLQMLRASMPTTVTIREDLDPDCGRIRADAAKIHQILLNLCTNAFHAMENQKGILGVRVYGEEISREQCRGEEDIQPGAFVVMEICDTGHGMDKSILDQIFDPFFTTKSVGQGTGLGLSVIHGIVKDYHGFIRVDSSPGRGSCFKIFLPRHGDDVPDMEGAVQESPGPGTGRERILLVDDETSIVEMNRKILERRGYRVTAVEHSQEALEMIRKTPDLFDLVITDQTMPDLTGAELAGKILEMNPGMPIILCTGHSAVVSREDALGMGIREYLEKPVGCRILEASVRKTLDRPKYPN